MKNVYDSSLHLIKELKIKIKIKKSFYAKIFRGRNYYLNSGFLFLWVLGKKRVKILLKFSLIKKSKTEFFGRVNSHVSRKILKERSKCA